MRLAGVFVDVEGWLETLAVEEGSEKEESWVPFWFALMTKEASGLADSRSLQYSSSPEIELPEHAIPLPLARALEPCVRDHIGHFDINLTTLRLEARDCVFTLSIPPPRHAPSLEERVYTFRAEDAATAAGWVYALQDESNASPFRQDAKSEEEVSFLSSAYTWMEEVFMGLRRQVLGRTSEMRNQGVSR